MTQLDVPTKAVYRLAGLVATAVLTSSATALVVLYFLRLRRRGRDTTRSGGGRPAVGGAPVQPAVSTAAPADAPSHFSEDLLVPGLTSTGPEIVRQDIEDGRSPEGV